MVSDNSDGYFGKKILLINPKSPSLNTSPPLGLAYLGAQLKKFEYEVEIVDASAPYNALSDKQIINIINIFDPDVVGITIMTLFAKEAYDLINYIKSINKFVIAGGCHATIMPEEALLQGADVVIRGEGEITLIDFLGTYFSGGDFKDINGISYKYNNSIVHNSDREFIDDLDVLPYPDKDLFDPSWYNKDGKPTNESYGTVLTSRGCPGRCKFCSRNVFKNKVRYNSPDYIINYMLYLKNKYRINRFYILDDNFVTNKKRLLHICELIKTELPDIEWACNARIDHVNFNSLSIMKSAGCKTITYGIESGSNKTLERINKFLTADKITSIVKMTHDLGFEVCANWMMGYPFESAEDVDDTRRLVIKIDPYIKIHNAGFLTPFPGTEIYEAYKHLESVKEYWLENPGSSKSNHESHDSVKGYWLNFTEGSDDLKKHWYPFDPEIMDANMDLSNLFDRLNEEKQHITTDAVPDQFSGDLIFFSNNKFRIYIMNTGKASWTKETNLFIGTMDKRDHASAYHHPSWIRPNRICTFKEDIVPPGSTATFEFTINSDPHIDPEAFQLVVEGVCWVPNTKFRLSSAQISPQKNSNKIYIKFSDGISKILKKLFQ